MRLVDNMTSFKLISFNKVFEVANLNEENKIIGRKLCNFTQGDNQFHAMAATVLSLRQDMMSNHKKIFNKLEEINERISTTLASTVGGWDEKSELKCIMDGDVQAYTATHNKEANGDTLPLSLHAKLMSAILSNPTEWKNRLLPSGYGAKPNPKATKALQKTLTNICKQTRKEFETILLTKIHLPRRKKAKPCTGNIPDIDTIIVKLHEKEKSQIGGRVQVCEEIIKTVEHLRKTRYAWLRMQASHWGTHEIGVFTCYFVLALYNDYDIFNGECTWTQLRKNKTKFSLPSEERVQKEIKKLELKFGDDMGGDESLHPNTA
ncbi:uncharacterized protein MELLADRAFT_93084 [Melampsora larici-populina 98AG31]|uniref:Uncharacterized protein n=1 Tax=Melampsora larici-populina (strain 98AG31 / pathotype 3-4-7) TaxID=747676 RepID=F4S3W5_MELLP|nr:uncharacterized protein MELLADRAFT_93084 [Melampsora larici-populina 98AG31]EGG00669.1 hypothetical protein MELLADRAFT_93084 [Melampsora larici-populina 98AG31]